MPLLVVVHEALNVGHCHLALGVPSVGKFAGVGNLQQLRDMGWTREQPLRVVTGARIPRGGEGGRPLARARQRA